jgi:hypothetical protein
MRRGDSVRGQSLRVDRCLGRVRSRKEICRLRMRCPRLELLRGQTHPEGVRLRKGLEGCGAATPQAGPERESAEPRKARFPAEPEMRPNLFYS